MGSREEESGRGKKSSKNTIEENKWIIVVSIAKMGNRIKKKARRNQADGDRG